MESICSKTIKINENNEKKQFITFIVLKAITPLLNIHCHFPLQGEYRSASFLSVSLNEFSQAEAARKLGRVCSVYWVELSSQYCHIVSTRHRSAQKNIHRNIVSSGISNTYASWKDWKLLSTLRKQKVLLPRKVYSSQKGAKISRIYFDTREVPSTLARFFFTLGTKKM